MKKIKYTAKTIADECKVNEESIIKFIRFCKKTKFAELPDPIPYERSKYTYTKEDAEIIKNLFINKPRGAMAEFNYIHNWGSKYRQKYKKYKKPEDKAYNNNEGGKK